MFFLPVDDDNAGADQRQCDKILHGKYRSLSQEKRGEGHAEDLVHESEHGDSGDVIVLEKNSPEGIGNG